MRRNKNILVFILSLIMITLTFCNVAFAHSGKTDEDGGHYDSSASEYHYHHGYPAHQHTNGICPYNFKDNTSENSKKTSSDNKQENIKPIFLISFSIIMLIIKIISICKRFLMYENMTFRKAIAYTIAAYIIVNIITIIVLIINKSKIGFAPFLSLFIINIPEIIAILSSIIISSVLALLSIPSAIKSIVLKMFKK